MTRAVPFVVLAATLLTIIPAIAEQQWYSGYATVLSTNSGPLIFADPSMAGCAQSQQRGARAGLSYTACRAAAFFTHPVANATGVYVTVTRDRGGYIMAMAVTNGDACPRITMKAQEGLTYRVTCRPAWLVWR
jgi:hypothetical protein